MNNFDHIPEFKASAGITEELKKIGTVKHLAEGDLLFHEQSYVQSIPVILKGSVRVYQTDDDYREVLLYYLKPGDTCIMSVLGGLFNHKNKLKAVANEESEVLLLPVSQAGKLIKNHPEWIEYIFRTYYQRFNELLDVVNAVAFKKMDERLMQYLTRKSNLTGSKIIEITHEELANELATARVVISRLLKQMEKEKLLELGRNRITLL
jgi:CRP/FNR family transcriptional regulator, anaerobic regulatory protein